MLRLTSGFVQGQRQENDTRDEFRGTWMLVAQWDRVHPDPHGADDHMDIPEALLERVGSVDLCSIIALLMNCKYFLTTDQHLPGSHHY